MRSDRMYLKKINVVDYIWKNVNLEGIVVTYDQTLIIYDGGVVNVLTVDNIITINNLKYSWEFILENEDMDYDFGCGIISISQENQSEFFSKLIEFYETGDNKDVDL